MPSGDNSIATRFKIGDKAAEKWTEESTLELLVQMRNNSATDDKILCLQDAIHSVGLYGSGLDYLLEKFPIFVNIKKDIQDIIIARVNKRALQNDFNPASSIWRMKQLGEKDATEVSQNVRTINVNIPDG